MPIHDWARVEAGIFHAFHHSWISELARALNRGLLPDDHYALIELHAATVGPDVVLQGESDEETENSAEPASPVGGGPLAPPNLQPTAETDLPFYRRKQNSIAVRHVRGDSLVARVEIVAPGNKAGRGPLRAFVEKAAELIDNQVHLLILDLVPPGKRDPQGIHGEIWEEIAGGEYMAPAGKPLTLAAYESALGVRAYVVPAAVGDELTEMPLFLQPEKAVSVPLEATYRAAFAAMPRQWRRVLEAP